MSLFLSLSLCPLMSLYLISLSPKCLSSSLSLLLPCICLSTSLIVPWWICPCPLSFFVYYFNDKVPFYLFLCFKISCLSLSLIVYLNFSYVPASLSICLNVLVFLCVSLFISVYEWYFYCLKLFMSLLCKIMPFNIFCFS